MRERTSASRLRDDDDEVDDRFCVFWMSDASVVKKNLDSTMRSPVYLYSVRFHWLRHQ